MQGALAGGGLIVISGPAASGKSTLAARAAEQAQRERPGDQVTFLSGAPVHLGMGLTCRSLAECGDTSPAGDVLVLDEVTCTRHARWAITRASEGALVLVTVTAGGPRAALSRVRELADCPDGSFRRMLADVLVMSFSQLLMPAPGGLVPVRETVENDGDLALTIRSGGHLGSAPRTNTRQEER